MLSWPRTMHAVMQKNKKKFIFQRKTTEKRQIINNDFTLWKAATRKGQEIIDARKL